MKAKKHLWENKRFTGMLVGNFLMIASVFVILILVLVLLTQQFALQSVYGQLGESNLLNLHSQINQMESNVKTSRSMLLRTAQDQDVNEYLRPEKIYVSEYEHIALVNRISSNLRLNSSWIPFMDTVFVYNQKEDHVISSDSGMVPRNTYKDNTWMPLFTQLLEKGQVPPTLRAHPQTGRPILTIVQQLPLLLNSIRGVAIANIDCYELFDNVLGGIPYIITDHEGAVICSDRRELVFAKLDEALAADDAREINTLWQKPGSHLVTVEGSKVLVSVAKSPNYEWWVYSIDSLELYNARIRQFNQSIFVITLIALTLALIFAYMISRKMFLPVKRILYVLEERSDEMILPMESRNESQNEIAFLADTVLHTMDRNKELSQTLAQRLQRLNQTRLRMLQSQINPHFLYNTLATINWMVLEKLQEDNEISDALCSLSELLRESLKSPTFVPVPQEIRQVQRYVVLQQLCFQERLELTQELEEGTEEYAIPSMILQPLVENTIKHGFNHVEGEVLHIKIKVELLLDKRLLLTVEDDGVGMSDEALATLNKELLKEEQNPVTAIGLRNVSQQIKLLFDEEGLMTLEKAEPKGLKVKIEIPCIKISDLPSE